MKKKFSIIIPVYNVENYLRRCVLSILQQDYESLEIILVDDGSTDRSGAMCDELAADNPKTVCVIHKKNGGISDARNVGMLKAQGEYILFVDSDDYWTGQFLDQLSHLLETPADVVISGGFDYIYEDRIEPLRHPFDQKTFDHCQGEEALFIYVQSPSRRWAVWQNIYNREFLLQHNLFFPLNRTCEDVDWTYRVILKAQTIRYFDQVFYQYLADRPTSIMNTLSYQRWQDLMHHCLQWLQRIKTLRLLELKNRLEEIFVHIMYLYLKELIFVTPAELRHAEKMIATEEHFKKPLLKEDQRVQTWIKTLGFYNYIRLLRWLAIVKRLLNQAYKKLIGVMRRKG